MASGHVSRARAQALAPSRGSKAQAERPPAVKLEFKQVVAAVASLYDNQLKPFGRILLKRVGERASAEEDGSTAPFVDARRLRRVCESCPRLLVEAQAGGEYVALLRGRAPAFVDPADTEDPYPEAMWTQLTEYFSDEGEGSRLPLPGGRYACARALMARELPCLAHRSLGEVCHIVALAVAQRRILGYSEGSTVPFCRSEASLKEMCAARQLPICNTKGGSSLTMASWEDTRACLWELLNRAESRGNPGLVPVPNVKRLFRSQFQLELSETALGHSRLQDLLNDEKLRDVCEVRQCGSMNVVAKAGRAPPQQEQSQPALVNGSAGVGYFPAQPSSPASSEFGWQQSNGLAAHAGNQYAAMAGYLEATAYMDPNMYMGQGMYALPEPAMCDQYGIDLWNTRLLEQQWVPATPCQAMTTPAPEPPAPQPAEIEECGAPVCLTTDSFFDFLGHDFRSSEPAATSSGSPVAPPSPASIAPSDKCPTESTHGSLSDAGSGMNSDNEDENISRRTSPTGSDRPRLPEDDSETLASDSFPLQESFWELVAQEDFIGRPTNVIKNTFIHIAPDAQSSIAASGLSKQRRHVSVPRAARLNYGAGVGTAAA